MKIKVAIEVDLSTGNYDVRCDNLSQPGAPIDVHTLGQVVGRIMGELRAPSVASQAILGLPLTPAKALLN